MSPRKPKYEDPERQRLERPDPMIQKENKCGRWRHGKKREAIERYDRGEPYSNEGRCRRPMSDGRPCRLHGGRTLKGEAHPSWKHGRRSKWAVPEHMRESFEKALNNPQPLQMSDEIALVDSRVQELLDNMSTGESRTAWARARTALGQLRVAFASGDQQNIKVAVAQLYQVIEQGEKSAFQWDEVFEAIQHRRQIVETERRRIESESAYMTAEAAMTLSMRLVELTRKYLQPTQYSEFATEIRTVMGVAPKEILDVNPKG